MKRALSSFLVGLFILAVVVVPAVHQVHCAGGDADHHASDCPVCQLAATSLVSVVPSILPICHLIAVGEATIAVPVVVQVPRYHSDQARAPPAV